MKRYNWSPERIYEHEEGFFVRFDDHEAIVRRQTSAMADMPVDIVDALEADGSPLSLRAARYIRIKRNTEEGLHAQMRRMREISLASESTDGNKP